MTKHAESLVLEYLKLLIDEDIPCPSTAEISAALGYKHHSSVGQAFSGLLKRDVLRRTGTSYRRVYEIVATGEKTPPHPVLAMPVKKLPNIKAIIQSAADIFSTTTEDILSKSRFREHCRPRFAVVFVARKRGWQYQHIAHEMARDHSTIMHANRQARDLIQRDEDFDFRCAKLARLHPVKELMA